MDQLDFRVRKSDLRQGEWVSSPAAPLQEGEARLRVERFVLTANNITYAAAGDGALAYWRFFPAPEGWGRVPVWGYATVEASRAPGLEAGELIYGYLPMSSHLTVRPERLSAGGFVDASAHRAGLPPVYNQYNRVQPAERLSDAEMVLRPLFMTSFLIDDFLADNGFFGAKRVILTSASSRTTVGLAFMLAKRAGAVESVGLTSPRNRDFVESLGFYDRVVLYDDVAGLDATPSVMVDMSGDAAVIHGVHHRLGEALKYSCVVGMTHWESDRSARPPLPGPTPTLFFAPDVIMKRRADWGPDGLQQRYAPAWSEFTADAGRWLTIEPHSGQAGVEAAYAQVVSGEARPSQGHIVSL
jgi:hypothetical protein